MPLTFRDHLKRDGWIPLTSFHRNQAVAERLKSIKDHRRQRKPIPTAGSVEDLKELIESDPDLYMQFTQMFEEAGPGSLVGGATMFISIIMLMSF